MRTLDEILDGLTVEVQPFAICEARGDGAIDAGARDHATLHFVLAGCGNFTLFGKPEISANTGTVLITPARIGHLLKADRDAPCQTLNCGPLGDNWQLLSVGDGVAGIIVACSDISVSYRGIEGLFDYLQEPLICHLQQGDPLKAALEQILSELANPRAGSRGLVRALMQQCLIHLLRQTSSNAPSQLRWLAAVNDDRLWRAMQAIFDDPGAPHSLEGLSEIAQMSRSSFAEHFRTAFNHSPMELLKQTRLQLAAHLLISSDLSIKAIARETGYLSRSYFSRAFHEYFAASPLDFRKQQRRDAAP